RRPDLAQRRQPRPASRSGPGGLRPHPHGCAAPGVRLRVPPVRGRRARPDGAADRLPGSAATLPADEAGCSLRGARVPQAVPRGRDRRVAGGARAVRRLTPPVAVHLAFPICSPAVRPRPGPWVLTVRGEGTFMSEQTAWYAEGLGEETLGFDLDDARGDLDG